MRIVLAALAAALLNAGPMQAAPRWTPSPTTAARLAPPVISDGYQVRPPQGFTELARLNDKNAFWFWVRPNQPKNHSLFLTFAIGSPAPDEPQQTLPQVFAEIMDFAQSEYMNFKVTPAQKGTVHSIPFLRCYWTGTEKASGHRM